ncbi:MAG: Mth938-like domain-containing protein [Rubrobacteraceae bacterium]|uniref:Mth938-like domain-containing protein n=1 Tax=Rubrobacter naiadicus TaxID=1392641 RepID=UPI0023603085|nr:Mth938-like domain-containing protein [Rubrobacter naiadicus]MCL6437771.1 Mth938-like domain-containing protein [Rubrobacteraceae bacterium]
MRPAPRVTGLSWGRIETEIGSFRDARLFPGGAREWDWGETGTHHHPGVQPADVSELLERGAREVIIGCGFHGRLGVSPETRVFLEGHGIELHVLQTPEAAALYERLCEEGRAVGALVHSTC